MCHQAEVGRGPQNKEPNPLQSVRPIYGSHGTGPEPVTCQVPLFQKPHPWELQVSRPSESIAPSPPTEDEETKAQREGTAPQRRSAHREQHRMPRRAAREPHRAHIWH